MSQEKSVFPLSHRESDDLWTGNCELPTEWTTRASHGNSEWWKVKIFNSIWESKSHCHEPWAPKSYKDFVGAQDFCFSCWRVHFGKSLGRCSDCLLSVNATFSSWMGVTVILHTVWRPPLEFTIKGERVFQLHFNKGWIISWPLLFVALHGKLRIIKSYISECTTNSEGGRKEISTTSNIVLLLRSSWTEMDISFMGKITIPTFSLIPNKPSAIFEHEMMCWKFFVQKHCSLPLEQINVFEFKKKKNKRKVFLISKLVSKCGWFRSQFRWH